MPCKKPPLKTNRLRLSVLILLRLSRLPGLVGDIEPEAEKGRIGLVPKQGGEIARSQRFYI